MKRFIVLPVVLILTAVSLFAQSAEKISAIISTQEVTYAQAAYLAASYLYETEGLAGAERLNEQSAFEEMVQGGYIRDDRSADSAIPLNELSLLYMRVTSSPGGLFYTLLQNPRYAYRELKAHGVIPETADPSQKVGGRSVIAVLNGCIELAGGAE